MVVGVWKLPRGSLTLGENCLLDETPTAGYLEEIRARVFGCKSVYLIGVRLCQPADKTWCKGFYYERDLEGRG